ncbi:uncharacterized protein HMPREF1541_08527 [Cyphellophora europaea CBS 101466]|uniref:Xylanolytic transcriptional activator regulatory domain-containing protein n=1 Tax=Cyphellophora europaea (strain CBS 101466) TaxID=1220924 RepID=W2RIT2_CYPE1|nr:uncharacterized protein HMPREF1541_08527 [Cyphellophora europaea CBS 101466]ETN36250.1 hypothetical protein HMPREF1541_08527 [Cyphellophora europaea CBS 101466]
MFEGNTFQASKTDWLGATADYSDRQTLGSVHLPSESPYDLDFRQPRGEIAPGTASTPAVSVPTDGHSADVSAGKDGASDWPHALDQGGGVWPFDYTSNRGYRRIRLPPLRQVLEETVGQRPSIEKATLSDLIKILSAPRIPCVNDSPAPEALPAVNFLTKLIRIYFEEFHPVANVIHLPTWRVEDCPTALLAAMACLGATYSTAEGSSEVAVLLAEITQRSLLWMGQADTTNFKDPAFITAMCLHHTYSLGSGNRRLYELADAARGTMVTSLRSTGILSLEASEGETLSSDNLQQMTESELEVAWAQWRSSETLKRVAWMVFEFDCTVSMMTNKRGAFSISELPTRLPCADSLWEAQCASAKAWASMVFFSTESRRGLQTYTLMQQLTSQRSVISTIPSWGKRLCAQTISRLLWDLKEMKDASAPIALGIPSIAAGYKSSNDTLLQSLNILNESLSSPINMSDIVNMNVTSLGIYYTDLINRTSAMDLIIFIFRNSGRERSPQLAAELTRAETHLCNTFAHDPVDTRRSVVSAANIITIARECTSTTPCEVMRLFNGYAYLLAFTCFFPFERLHTRGAAAKLDVLPWRRTAIDETGLKAWVERSGPASFLSVDDICDSKNFETLKQEGLRALDGLRTWGLARKFYRVLQSLT